MRLLLVAGASWVTMMVDGVVETVRVGQGEGGNAGGLGVVDVEQALLGVNVEGDPGIYRREYTRGWNWRNLPLLRAHLL